MDFSTSLKEADAKDRVGFVKKVYSILFAQLLITGICIGVTITQESICWWMVRNWWVYLILVFVALAIEIAMICVRPLARKVPANYIMLLLFTLCEAYLVSYLCMIYSYQEECDEYGQNCEYNFGNRRPIICAATGTVAITAACTAYACTTKTDFTAKWGIIFVFAMALLILSIFGIIFYSYILQMVICTLGVLLFGIYLIMDT